MSDDQGVKKAAELLKQGAVMLDLGCPVCNYPLFKLKNGDIICPNHGKVYIVKSEEEEKLIKKEFILSSIGELLVNNLHSISNKLREDPMDIETLKQMIYYLDALERLEKIRRLDFSHTQKQS
jgi:UPF0148 protein